MTASVGASVHAFALGIIKNVPIRDSISKTLFADKAVILEVKVMISPCVGVFD